MRVLLVDDHTLFREGMKLMLFSLNSKITILQAGSCEEAVDIAGNNDSVDIILLDMKLSGASDVAAIKMIHAKFVSARIVVLSGEVNPKEVHKTIEAGAMGFIPKSSSPELLMEALAIVIANGVFLPAEFMLAIRAAEVRGVAEQKPALSLLTARQRDVLHLMVTGASNKAISKQLNIKETTVKTHIQAVFNILAVKNRTESVIVAAKLGLILNGRIN